VARRRERGFPRDPEPLPLPVADNHTHLESIADVVPEDVPAPSVSEHLERAAAAGVDRLVQVGCDVESARWTDALVREHAAILGAVAIHPNEATLHGRVDEVGPDGLTPQPAGRHEATLDEAVSLVADLARGNDRIRAIGETGMDLFRTGERGAQVQRASFRAHLALAKELGLALQIHDRDAHAEVIEVLLDDGAPERTVFHCFSGDAEMARLCVANGWYLSFAGPVTYKANDHLREALREVPLDLLLVETDAPYLTPHPFRGQPNAPFAVAHTVRAMAEILERPLEEVCAALSATSERVYGRW
jgi:TatD DNase family protein